MLAATKPLVMQKSGSSDNGGINKIYQLSLSYKLLLVKEDLNLLTEDGLQVMRHAQPTLN